MAVDRTSYRYRPGCRRPILSAHQETGTATGTGQVQVAAVQGSQVSDVELFGDPNLTLAPTIVGGAIPNTGPNVCNPYIIMRFMAPGTNASNPVPMATTQPADGSVLGAAIYLSNSSVKVGGE